MNIHAFLIDLKGKDWNKLLGHWRPPIPLDASLWLVNRLGDAFLIASDGAVHWLNVGTGSFTEIAPSREAFAQLLDQREYAEAWLKISLVEECRRSGIQLADEECYGFKIPPKLLGKYEVTNIQPTNIYSHYSWLSHMARQDEIYWTGD